MTTPHLHSHLSAHQNLRILELDTPALAIDTTVIHPHASIALYLRGSTTLWCGTTYQLERADVILIPQGMPHYTITWEQPHILGLALCSSCMRSVGGRLLVEMLTQVSKGASARRTLEVSACLKLETRLRDLAQELEGDAPLRELAIEGHLALIATALERAIPTPGDLRTETRGPTLCARALSFVTQHAREGISLVDVARHVHRSPAHTSAVIKAQTGRTVVDWITHTRLSSACQLLLDTDDTVESIAARVGFKSPSHFHRTFRRIHRATPGAWRAVHRTGDS